MFRKDLTMVMGLSFFFAFILLPFQNCSKVAYREAVGSRSPASTTKGLQMGGNGTGYDGKVYVNRGTCGVDENALKNVLSVSLDGQEAYLLKEDCQKIEPKPVALSEILVASVSGDVVVLNGTNFVSKEFDDSQLIGDPAMGHQSKIESRFKPKDYRPLKVSKKAYSKPKNTKKR